MIAFELQILIAVLLDLLLGDPRCYPHPVTLIAKLAKMWEKVTRAIIPNEYFAGVLTVLLTVGITGGIVWGGKILFGLWAKFAADVFSILIMYACFATRDLSKHSNAVYAALRENDLELARAKVGMIVGRDTNVLDSQGVTRATVESVAENLIDGVTAPLMFAIAAGPVGAMVYKAINTLDSTFGYKDERNLRFGWASARIDDVANWLPARLTLPLIAIGAWLVRQNGIAAVRIGWRDRAKHSSPNSAWGEAAVAGALGVQLSGPTCYKGEWTNYPTLGDAVEELEPRHIRAANRLMYVTMFVTVAAGLAARFGVIKCAGVLVERIGL